MTVVPYTVPDCDGLNHQDVVTLSSDIIEVTKQCDNDEHDHPLPSPVLRDQRSRLFSIGRPTLRREEDISDIWDAESQLVW